MLSLAKDTGWPSSPLTAWQETQPAKLKLRRPDP